jgi:hypothetical protein
MHFYNQTYAHTPPLSERSNDVHPCGGRFVPGRQLYDPGALFAGNCYYSATYWKPGNY